MSEKIVTKAENLATLDLVIANKKAGKLTPAEELTIEYIIIDSPVQRQIGRQIIGCFGIGQYQVGSIYDKIAKSVVSVLNEASVEQLLDFRNNFEVSE